VLAASLRQANALENGVLANDSNIGEALRTNDFGVGLDVPGETRFEDDGRAVLRESAGKDGIRNAQ